MSENQYFQENNRAFEAVVRLDGTEPGSYQKDDIRADIEKYAQVSSLGKIHREAMQEIKSDLEKYGNTPDAFPEAKCYGIVGQYGDGKTHFLTCLSDLLRQENEKIYPTDLNLLVLDPFNFPRNPVDIVEALRERVQEEISPDAAEKIPQTAGNKDAEIEGWLRKAGGSDEDIENLLDDVEIRAIEGESAGKAFSEGVEEVVQNYKYDGIVLLMDEIEKISRHSDISYKELDRYREFFDEIGIEVPVYFLVTAPTDQWNHFEHIHSGAMDRMFGSQPRNRIQLQTLNEEELANTWSLRRDQYLRTDNPLPVKYDNELYPLHTSTLRSIHEIARRARSNRTAIELMKEVYNEFLSNGTGWMTPGTVFERSVTAATDTGSIFNPQQHADICEYDEDGVLTSVAGTLNQGIAREELIEVLELSESELENRIENLQNNSWIIALDEGPSNSTVYRLQKSVLEQLEPDADIDTDGDVEVTVRTVMANVDQSPDLIQRNLLQVLRDHDFFDNRLKRVQESDHYLSIEGNFGNYHDRTILTTTGDLSATEIGNLREEEGAEIALAVNHGRHNYDDHERIINFEPSPWDTRKEYQVEGLEYELGQWLSAYDSLQSELESGGRQLLNSIKEWTYQEVIGLDEFELTDRIKDRLTTLYPKYPGPIDRMNSQALSAYKEALSRGKVEGTLSWEEVAEDYGYAKSQNAITNYFEEWEKYDLATVDLGASPAYAQLKMSATENLILEELDSEKSTPLSDVANALQKEGYRDGDIVEFIELLKDRDKIRENDDGELLITTTDLTIARTYYDVVRDVAEWLTDDAYPEQFQNQYISDRDTIVEQLGTCRSTFDQLGSDDIKTEESNIVASFISDIENLHEICLRTVQEFENTQTARAAFEAEGKIEELRQVGDNESPSSNEFTIIVGDLGSKSATLANAAQRRFNEALGGEESSIFEALNQLHDEFADEFKRLGPYGEYNTEPEMQDVRKRFHEQRPETEHLAEAIEVVESFEDRIGLAKDLARSGHHVMENLLEIEEFDKTEYQTTEAGEIAEQSQAVVAAYEEAAKKNETIGKRIADQSFTALDRDTLDDIQEDVSEANEALETAETKQAELDDRINRETRQTHQNVNEFSSTLSTITSERGEEINEMFAPKEGDANVVDQASVWWEELNDTADRVTDLANNIQQTFPETAEGLLNLQDQKDSFDDHQSAVGELRNELINIHQAYFEEVREEMPPKEADEFDEIVYESLSGGPLAQIETLLNRIQEMNESRGIDIASLPQRIKMYIEQNGTVPPPELAAEVPDERFRETGKQVIQEVTHLIQERELELTYNNGTVLVTQS